MDYKITESEAVHLAIFTQCGNDVFRRLSDTKWIKTKPSDMYPDHTVGDTYTVIPNKHKVRKIK